MSRSFKKYPCYGFRRSIKKDKKIMNHIIHTTKEMKNGGFFKKVTSDYYWITIDKYCPMFTLEENVKRYLEYGDTIEDAYIDWIKNYYYK